MTLWAAKDGKNVKVQCTYGPITFAVTEDPAHVRVFHDELGKVLAEMAAALVEQEAGG